MTIDNRQSPKRRLTLGHSPDPDDAFMFYGLAAAKIDTHGWEFEHVLQDIQTLNDRALRGELDITAISIHAYPYVADKYVLTNCGSSMGDGYGPMVVAKEPLRIEDLAGKRIAVPGLRTTAFLALQLLLGEATKPRSHEATEGNVEIPARRDQNVETEQNRARKEAEGIVDCSRRTSGSIVDSIRAQNDNRGESSGIKGPRDRWAGAIPPIDNRQSTIDNPISTFRLFDFSTFPVVMFDQILRYVEDGHADAGLIIHEGQLTYQRHKLHLVVDLGAWWKETTGLPLPLGGNVIRRDLAVPRANGDRDLAFPHPLSLPKGEGRVRVAKSEARPGGRDHDPTVPLAKGDHRGSLPAIEEIAGILKQSIEYSLAHRDEAVAHAMQYARDMGKDLADRFVGMYVNHWTLDYGDAGRHAVRELLRRAHAAGLVPDCGEIDFIG